MFCPLRQGSKTSIVAVVSYDARLKRLMRRRNPYIYFGNYSTCVIGPTKAMCRPQPELRGTTRPAQASCQPSTAGTPH